MIGHPEIPRELPERPEWPAPDERAFRELVLTLHRALGMALAATTRYLDLTAPARHGSQTAVDGPRSPTRPPGS